MQPGAINEREEQDEKRGERDGGVAAQNAKGIVYCGTVSQYKAKGCVLAE